MFTEPQTRTTDTSTGTSATTARIKDGGLTERDTTTQDNQSLVELSSRSDLECQPTNLCSGMSILEDTNTDSECTGTTHSTPSNGSPSTPELKLSEPGQEEDQ